MINGFTVEIINNASTPQELLLFKEGGIPKSVQVNVINNLAFDYNVLLNLALTQGFSGTGVHVNSNSIDSITVYNAHNVETLYFNNQPLITDLNITINGSSSYMSLFVPAATNMVLQLMPNL
jgi:hypothetical protein